MQDLQYALRTLRKHPGFAAVVVLSLALGIGANTAIFTLIDAVLLRTLPVQDPGSLRFVTRHQENLTGYGFLFREFQRLRGQDRGLRDVAAYSSTRINVSIDGSVEPTAEGQLVSGNFFSTLGVDAAIGRTIGPDDDRHPNAHPVVVISFDYWKRRFGLDSSALGRTLTLSGTPFTIIGIAPSRFSGLEVGRAPDLYVPIMMQPTVMPAVENWLGDPIIRATWLTLIGRLPADRTDRQVQAELAGLDVLDPLMTKPRVPGEASRRIPEHLGLAAAATGLSGLRQQYSQPLFILMAVVGLVLLIACANVANLVLARAAARSREFSLRLSLGAGRWRLMRQLLVESLVLAIAGGALGVAVARWATGLLVTFMSSGRTPIVLDLTPDLRVLTFTAAVSLLTGIFFGFAPAWRAGRADVIRGLKGQGSDGSGGRLSLRPGKILVVSQVALCLLLLVAAGLFIRSFQNLDGQDRGFDRDSVLVIRLEPRGSDQRGIPGASDRLDRIYRELQQRVEAIPGVRSASLAHFSPTSPIGFSSPIQLSEGPPVSVARMMVYPRFFATMSIPLVSGRDFEPGDLDANVPYRGVVNEAFVRKLLNGENPVGKQYRDARGGSREIIGVVRDTKYASLRSEVPPLIYQPFLQTNTGRGQMTLHVRTAAGAAGVVSRVREEVQRIDRDMPLLAMHTLSALMDGVLSRERLVAALTSLFGLLALLLASIGLYGLMAFSVVRRTAEMGLRMALGADRRRVIGTIMREALILVFAGLAIGVPAAWLIGRLAVSQLSGLLFGLSATDPVTISGAVIVLLVVAAGAAYVPAMRASRVHPMVALRTD